MSEIDVNALSDAIAKSVGRRYRLARLGVRSSYPVFRGEADGASPVFVKLGRQDEWRRTVSLFRDVGPLGLFVRLLTDDLIVFQGQVVFVMEWRDMRIVYPEDMTNSQADDLTAVCVRLAESLQAARDFVPLGTPSGGEGSLLGIPPEALYKDVSGYVSRHPLVAWALKGLVGIPSQERTYGARPLQVVHGDFHARNYGFSGDRVSSVFDFEGLTQGLACTSLTYALVWRFACLGLAADARRRLHAITRRILGRVPWSRQEMVIACNIARLQFAVRRIRKHPNSAWVAFDILRRDRAIREFLAYLD